MGDESTVLRLVENGTQETAALSPTQARLLSERYGDYLVVQPAWEPGVFRLTARQSIGVIVADGLRIHIAPKVPLTNLFYMLTYAYDLPIFRDEESPLAVGEDLFEFLVEIFVKQVDGLVRRGIHRGYVDWDENAPYLRGRLMMGEHLRRNSVQPVRFAQSINTFTADLRENRILKFTLWRLAGAPYRDEELRRRVRRALSAFSEVSLVAVGPEECDRVVYTRLNGRYRTPINLAQLFIRHLSLEGHAGETPFMTYLLSMHRVFELFVARYLSAYFDAHPTLSVSPQESIWLDEAFYESGRLDIVLRRAGKPFLILDTKYKTFDGAPKEDDRNQMVVYCSALDVPRGMLIYADARPVHYERRFKGVALAARSLALGGPLEEFRARMQAFAAELAVEVANS